MRLMVGRERHGWVAFGPWEGALPLTLSVVRVVPRWVEALVLDYST